MVAPEPGVRGILWVEDHALDLSIATLHVSRRYAITAGHGWTPDRKLIHFTGCHKDEQVCALLQQYEPRHPTSDLTTGRRGLVRPRVI